MQHGPDPYQRALADLDELLDEQRRDSDARWVACEARHAQLVAAVRAAIGRGDVINDSKRLLMDAIRQ